MKPRGINVEHLQSGDAKPYQDTKNTFICRYDVQTNDFDRTFRTFVDRHAETGNTLRIIFFRYAGETPADAGETITNWQPDDFVGQVFTTRPHPDDATRSPAVPVVGVTVTIVSGPRSGEKTVTDKNGRYRFLSVKGDELHLRTEKNHFEPKEAIVYRSRPTSLPDGSVPNHHKDPQKEPGNILIGQVWPDEVRPLLEEVLLVHDLLYIEAGVRQESGFVGIAGYYGSGIVFMFSNKLVNRQDSTIQMLRIFEHEIAHAHQHAAISVDGSINTDQWIYSSEGKAYAEAREKDLDLGEKMYYDVTPYYANNLFENAAEHCANYWGQRRGAKPHDWLPHQIGKTLEELAPNRFEWAEEWLTKK